MKKFSLILISVFALSHITNASEVSLYDAKIGNFNDDAGKSVNLKEMTGKKVVISMVYTSCQMACPMMVKKLKKIAKKLKENSVDVEFVIVSFDSKFDTTEKMALFRKSQNITDPNWKLLVGNDKDTRFLSNLLDIRYSRNPKDQTISHDNKVVLLDEKGMIIRTLVGLSFDQEEKMFN